MVGQRRWDLTVMCAGALLCMFCGAAAASASRPTGQAIQFRVDSLKLTDFGSSAVAYQRFLSPDRALRVSVSIDLRYDADTTSQFDVDSDEEVLDESADHNNWGHSGSVAVELLWYRGETVSVFYGFGPRVSYATLREENSRYYDNYSRHSRETRESFEVGLQGCIGIQWTAADWLAFHAEYHGRALYSHVVESSATLRLGDYNEFSEIEVDTDRFTLDARGVRVGLSAYF
ncbi:MAG: hypothetical protein ABIG03_01205 [Candidatus Eisenbacteria bacterium]